MREKRCMFGTVETWLIYKFTGNHVTDVTNASRTMMMDINTQQWNQKVLNLVNLTNGENKDNSSEFHVILPKITSCSENLGKITDGGLKGISIHGSIGDQQGALVGQLCFKKGSVKNTYGTGCFMLMNTGTTAPISTHGLLTTVGYKFGNEGETVFALEGSVAIAGAGVNWLKNQVGIIKNPIELNEKALSVKDNGNVYFVPAFSGLLAPYWRPKARGVIIGLTLNSTSGHICRAVIESVCFQSYDILKAMEADSKLQITQMHVDGGMTKSKLMLQTQSDLLLHTDVSVNNMAESTALGAAICAGLSSGFWKSIDEVEKLIRSKRTEKTYTASRDKEIVDRQITQWQKAVKRTYDFAL